LAKELKFREENYLSSKRNQGGSNVGEYKKVSKKAFCGPAGGSPKGSFPVNSKKRARAALSYAHNAPNPSGIRACVKRKFPSVGKSSKKK